jgi:hypothetical protein
MMNKKLTRAQQDAKDARNYKAHDVMTLKMAHVDLGKLARIDFKASGVLITIKALNGTTLMEPVLISDGLSPETIKALQDDIKRTYDWRLELSKF